MKVLCYTLLLLFSCQASELEYMNKDLAHWVVLDEMASHLWVRNIDRYKESMANLKGGEIPEVEQLRKLQPLLHEVPLESKGEASVPEFVCSEEAKQELGVIYQQIVSLCQKIAFPLREEYALEAMEAYPCSVKITMMYMLMADLANAYVNTRLHPFYASSLEGSYLRLSCPDTIMLGDTTTVFASDFCSIRPERLFPSEGSVYVPEGPALLSYRNTQTDVKGHHVAFQFVPTQTGSHYIEVPFVLETEAGFQHKTLLGRCVWVREK